MREKQQPFRTVEPMMTEMGVLDAFRLLKSGVPVYVASAPKDMRILRLRGVWKDEDGEVHHNSASVSPDRDRAIVLAKAFGQRHILTLAPNPEGKGKVYLLRDFDCNCKDALRYVGSYTADGQWLITVASEGVWVPFLEDIVECVPVDITFPPVK
jgi:hypothetical protein